MTERPAVLIHGLHTGANGWESLVWGAPSSHIWGAIPRGVQLAWDVQTPLIFWGTGASERDGKKEAEVMYARAIEGIEDLAALCGTDASTLEAFLKERSYIDTQVKDTKEEIKACFDTCLAKNIREVVLVPYASQAPRAVREALRLSLENPTYAAFRHHVSIAPSDTQYVGVSMPDIVIFTPPHRGDRVNNPSHELARRTLDVLQKYSKAGNKDAVSQFLEKWDELLKKSEQE